MIKFLQDFQELSVRNVHVKCCEIPKLLLVAAAVRTNKQNGRIVDVERGEDAAPLSTMVVG